MSLPPPPPVANAQPPASKPKSSKAPLLIGCLVILFIVLPGILAAILIPGVHAAMNLARKNQASVQLRSIGLSYIGYVIDPEIAGKPLNAASLEEAATILSSSKMGTPPSLWYIDSDPTLEGKPVYQGMPAANVRPISFALVVNISKESFNYQCPIAWTRGLQEDGTWAKDSPFKGEGGHIIFGDGHAKWGFTLADFQLTDDAGKPITTLSQLKALCGPRAVVLEDKP